MIAMCEQPSPLDQWRKRLGGRRYRRTEPRPLAALSYRTSGPVIDGLINIVHLHTVILYDVQLRAGHCALRLAGFAGAHVPWGVSFAGPDQSRFRKDLRLQPVPGGLGYRLDLADEELLVLGLGLERELDRCERFCQQRVRPRPVLPKLWAGFSPAEAKTITGAGPELEAYAARAGRSPRRLLQQLRREHLGMILYPLAWTSHHWEQAAAVFADLEDLPRRQVFRLKAMPDDLAGFHGASMYDFRDHRGQPGGKIATAASVAC